MGHYSREYTTTVTSWHSVMVEKVIFLSNYLTDLTESPNELLFSIVVDSPQLKKVLSMSDIGPAS